MSRHVLPFLIGCVFLAAALAGCGGGATNVQATVDAAVAATASAQGRIQATIEAAVVATQVAQSNAPGTPARAEATPTAVETITGPTTASSPASPAPSATVAPQPVETPTTAAPQCQVVSAVLNLRSGPGQVYNPPLRSLSQGTALVPLSFVGRGFPDGQWVEVQVLAGGQRGWVSADAQFISCNFDLTSLPAGSAPPTPLPTPTRVAATLPPSPATPTRVPALAILPVDGGCSGTPNIRNNRNVKGGCNVLLPGFESYEVSNPMVFRDRMVFRAEVFDSNVGQTDGAGIDNVKFTIVGPNGLVHERTERTAGYCVFGGGEPDCTVWRFSEHGNKWPGGASLQTGTHSVEIVITPRNGSPVSWFWSFEVK